ncbi:putative Beta-grasp domain superfamily protein [Helianthus debilis subsp. tardiflorus]
MQLTLEFGGGLELLCDSVKVHNVDVDLPAEEKKLTMKHLLAWVRNNLIKERPEMFMKGDTVAKCRAVQKARGSELARSSLGFSSEKARSIWLGLKVSRAGSARLESELARLGS